MRSLSTRRSSAAPSLRPGATPLAGAVLALALGFAPAAPAHQTGTARIDVDALDGRMQVHLRLSGHDLAAALGWAVDVSQPVLSARLAANSSGVDAYLAERLTLSGDGRRCPPAGRWETNAADVESISVRATFVCPSHSARLRIAYRVLLDLDPQHMAYGRLRDGDASQDLLFDGNLATLELALSPD